MKKHNLLKIIAICFLVVVFLSWVIPTGSFDGTAYEASSTIPVGIINLFRLPIMAMQTFIQYFIVILAIGGFYGVVNKTGVYGNIIDNIAKKWKGKEKTVLVIVVLSFALISSLTGNAILLFATIPFVGAIILSLGYDKMTALLATIGSILVGQAGSTFGFTGAGYVKNILQIEMMDEVITKIIVFIILTGLYTFFISKVAKLNVSKEETEIKEVKKKTTKKEAIKETVKKVTKKDTKVETKKINIPLLYDNDNNQKSNIPLIIISIILLVLCFVGMYNWYYGLNVSVFNTLHTNISEITIKDYPIVANILSGISSLGYWGNYELAVALFIGAVIIAWLYNISINDFIDSITKGIKEMLPVAFIAVICNMVFIVMILGETNISMTFVHWIGSITSKFSLPVVVLLTLVTSLFNNDFYYVLSDTMGIIASYDAIYYPIIGVITNSLYNIMMMILPTSILLAIGLKYYDISYKSWIKMIWKYLLEAFVVIILVSIIVIVLI